MIEMRFLFNCKVSSCEVKEETSRGICVKSVSCRLMVLMLDEVGSASRPFNVRLMFKLPKTTCSGSARPGIFVSVAEAIQIMH